MRKSVDLDVAKFVAAIGRSDGSEAVSGLQTEGTSGSQADDAFPIERFESLETWIVANIAEVRRAIAAENA